MAYTFSIQSEKILFWMFRIMIYGLKTIGLAPVSLQTRAPTTSSCNSSVNDFLYSKIGLYYNIVSSTSILIIGVYELLDTIAYQYVNESSINKTLDLGHFSLTIFTAWFEIVYWAFSQNKAAYIMNRLSNVHCQLSAMKQQSSTKKMLIFLVMHTTFSVFLWIAFIVFTLLVSQSSFETAVMSVPIMVNYWFLVEYSIVLEYIARELESLNTNLLAVQDFSNDSLLAFQTNSDPSGLISSTYNQLVDVQLLHNIRSILYEVSQDVADFFSLPILPVILLFFYMIIYSIYYMIIPAVDVRDSSSPLSYNIVFVLWFSVSVHPIVLLCFYVTKTTNEAKRTAHVVHKLLASTKKQEIITELEHFSLQLIHEDWNFTAYGFFTLDFQLLQSVVSDIDMHEESIQRHSAYYLREIWAYWGDKLKLPRTVPNYSGGEILPISIFGATATYLIIIIQFAQPART